MESVAPPGESLKKGASMAKLASVNLPFDPFDKQFNIDLMVKWVERAAEQDVDLVVFPEECVNGLGTKGMNEFFPQDKLNSISSAELIPEGPTTQLFVDLAKKHDMYIVFGMAETDPDRWTITHNCAVLVGPEGYIGKHRKVHFPLAERMFHVAGDDFEVFDTKIGKVGLIVCYDICFPESARVCALKGADIICCPTGWPNITNSETDPDHLAHMTFAPARALENMVFVVQSNTSNGAELPPVFEGHSQIIGPNPGQVLARAGFDEEMVVAEADIQKEILNTRVVAMGGDDLIRDRRPSLYRKLVERDCYANYSDGLVTEGI